MQPSPPPGQAEPHTPTARPSTAVQQLIGLRRSLLRYAKQQVHEPDVAQDLVQDTLEAALRGLHRFEGRSSLMTWTFAILRHHIADHHRQRQRCVSLSSMPDGAADADEELDEPIDIQGLWRSSAQNADATAPEASLVRRQFWTQVERGMASLTASQAQVFRLRDLLDQDAAQVSSTLGMSTNHCHVTLHRARAKLRSFMAPASTGQHAGQTCAR